MKNFLILMMLSGLCAVSSNVEGGATFDEQTDYDQWLSSSSDAKIFFNSTPNFSNPYDFSTKKDLQAPEEYEEHPGSGFNSNQVMSPAGLYHFNTEMPTPDTLTPLEPYSTDPFYYDKQRRAYDLKIHPDAYAADPAYDDKRLKPGDFLQGHSSTLGSTAFHQLDNGVTGHTYDMGGGFYTHSFSNGVTGETTELGRGHYSHRFSDGTIGTSVRDSSGNLTHSFSNGAYGSTFGGNGSDMNHYIHGGYK